MKYRRQLIQTTNYLRSNSQSLKYEKFTPSGCKNIRSSKFEFVARTKLLFPRVTGEKAKI